MLLGYFHDRINLVFDLRAKIIRFLLKYPKKIWRSGPAFAKACASTKALPHADGWWRKKPAYAKATDGGAGCSGRLVDGKQITAWIQHCKS